MNDKHLLDENGNHKTNSIVVIVNPSTEELEKLFSEEWPNA